MLNSEAELVWWLEMAMAIPVSDIWPAEGRVQLASYLVSLTTRYVAPDQPSTQHNHTCSGRLLLEMGEEAMVYEETNWDMPSLPEMRLIK